MNNEKLFCIDCEGGSIDLCGDDPSHPELYQYRCRTCDNSTSSHLNMIDAESEWRNQELSIISYQKPGLQQYLNNLRSNS